MDTPDTTDPGKRIPKSIGTDTTLFGSYSLADFVVAGLPGVAVILATQAVVPPSLTVRGVRLSVLAVPLALLATGGGALFVYLTPTYASSLAWLGQFLTFHGSETDLPHDAVKEHAPIERVHARHDAIKRSDGALVGAIQVSPPTMALATDQEWAAKTTTFQDVLNTTVDFPIQIYSTTRSFPVEEYLAHYEDRRTDPDVASNDDLAALIDNYVEWYGRDLARRQMTIRDHYVLVPVTPADAQYDEGGILQRLAAAPLVGLLVRLWRAPSREAEHATMCETLDDRRRRLERGFRRIDGCTTSTVDATDLAGLVAEHWTGTEFDYDDPEAVIRTVPIVARGEQ